MKALLRTLILLLWSSTLGVPLTWAGPHQCKSWKIQNWTSYFERTFDVDLRRSDIRPRLDLMASECSQSISQSGLGNCFKGLQSYYANFARSMDQGMFSGRMSDQQYLSLQPPEAASVPIELQNGLPANWRELAAKKGWKFALFCSATAGTQRLVLKVPGGAFDKLLLFTTFRRENGNDPTKFETLQMQAIENDGPGMSAQHLPRYFFRTWSVGTPGTPIRHSVAGGRCIQCHMGGPRAIEVPKNPCFPTELGGVQNLAELNAAIVRKGPLDFSPYFDPGHFHAHLRVGSQGRCNSCHNGRDRTSLAFNVNQFGNFNMGNLYRKVSREQSMPVFDGEDHGPEARKNMVLTAENEYYALLKGWLVDRYCPTMKKDEPGASPNIGRPPRAQSSMR